MKDSLWIVIVVVVAFSTFLIGYAVPPLVEVGMIGGKGNGAEVGIKTDLDREMNEYYRDLSTNE